MKLLSLEIKGFRGFASSVELDFSADCIILVGANGRGKTTIFDAIIWALTGRIPRFGRQPISDNVVSLYSPDKSCRVSVVVGQSETDWARVTRTSDGTRQRLTIERNGAVTVAEAAIGELLRYLWSSGSSGTDPMSSFTDVLSRSIYLQQDAVRQFVEADTDDQRFAIVGEMLGAGRIVQLQQELEKARSAWSAETNQLEARIRQAAVRVEQLSATATSLEAPTSVGVPLGDRPAEWDTWWQAIRDEGVTVESCEFDSPEAPRALDTALRELGLLRLERGRRLDAISQALNRLEMEVAPTPQALSQLEANRAELESLSIEIASELQEAERQAEDEARALLEAGESVRELKVLAQLALRHLDGPCPVCTQPMDLQVTLANLHRLTGEDRPAPPTPAADRRVEIASRFRAAREALAQAEEAVTSASQEQRARARQQQELAALLLAAGLDPRLAADASQLRQRLDEDRRIDTLIPLAGLGESLGLALARVGEVRRLRQVHDELLVQRSRLERDQQELEARRSAGSLASSVLAALRGANEEFVSDQLRAIGPLFERIFGAVEPHPSLRTARFASRTFRGKGRMFTLLTDSEMDVSTEVPERLLSSSQNNVLAMSVFLSLNLGLEGLPLQTLIIDDPLQSLDDINLLGLVDVLRRTVARRQLIVSTHDVHFAGLLSRKLRPAPGRRTVVYELSPWTRTGAQVERREVAPDQLRLVMPSTA